MDVLGSRFSNSWTKNDLLFNILPWPAKEKYNKTLATLNKFSSEVILKRRALLVKGKTDDENNSDDESANKIVFVDLLLQGTVDGKSLDDEAILDQVNTLTFNVNNLETFFIYRELHYCHSIIGQKFISSCDCFRSVCHRST